MASDVGAALSRVPWRPLGWGGAAMLLALPLVAMQFSKDVQWTLSDFIVFGMMLLAVGIPLEVVARASPSWSYRGAAVLALSGAFLTVWANLAVGIVGSEDNPANLLFFGALLIGIAGAIAARFEARGMAFAAAATAISLGLAFAIAVGQPTDEPNVPHIRELIGTGVFAAFFAGSALLFRKAARDS